MVAWRTVSPYTATYSPRAFEEFSAPAQHNAFPSDNSKTNVMASFRDVTVMKQCPVLSPNPLAFRIIWDTDTTLIRKKNTTSLIRCPVFVLLSPL
ncbi:hypothetical protein TNCV_5137871 [Trichonephila clavipes]|nr:hypothetical protein TNCV_5137871 [Trichonephila clavipes]